MTLVGAPVLKFITHERQIDSRERKWLNCHSWRRICSIKSTKSPHSRAARVCNFCRSIIVSVALVIFVIDFPTLEDEGEKISTVLKLSTYFDSRISYFKWAAHAFESRVDGKMPKRERNFPIAMRKISCWASPNSLFFLSVVWELAVLCAFSCEHSQLFIRERSREYFFRFSFMRTFLTTGFPNSMTRESLTFSWTVKVSCVFVREDFAHKRNKLFWMRKV